MGVKTTLGTAAAGAVALPLAVPAIIGLAGFGAGGILAGSSAAAWMSSAAAAGGGAIASGSLIALCQSVGAAGLSAAGVANLGILGGAIGGGIATIYDRKTDAHLDLHNRQFQPEVQELAMKRETSNGRNEACELLQEAHELIHEAHELLREAPGDGDQEESNHAALQGGVLRSSRDI